MIECFGKTPEQIVMNLLISDGDKSRGQGNALFNKLLKRIRVISGRNDDYGTVTIIIFCTKFENKVDSDGSPTSNSKVELENPKKEPEPQP